MNMPAPLAKEQGFSIKTIELAEQGCTLCYADWQAQGTCKGTVIAVHGITRQKRDFDYMARYLAQNGYRVLAIDAPGRGGSSRFENPDDYNLQKYGQVFYAFLKGMGLDHKGSVHWVGSSIGGLIAMEIALQGHADVFLSVTLSDVTHKPNIDACHRIAGYVSENIKIWDSVERYVIFLKQNVPMGDLSDDEWHHFAVHMLVKTDEGYVFHFDPLIMRQGKKDLLRGVDLHEGLTKILCPMALVAGENSDMCTKDEIADFLALKPNARIHMCPKAGHVPSLSDKETLDFIGAFLSRTTN